MNVSATNGSASGVTVALTSDPTSQKPEFTSGCSKNGTASCTLSSVTDKQATDLKAQIAVASSASSVTSVKLTATASVTTTAKWTAPAADETTTVTAAAAAKPTSSAGAKPDIVMPLGPVPNLNVPDLNAQASLLIGAGNAAGLFPDITPSATPSASAADGSPSASRAAGPVAEASPVALGSPVAAAQVAGLIALGLAIMLTVTRLSVRRRPRPGKPGR